MNDFQRLVYLILGNNSNNFVVELRNGVRVTYHRVGGGYTASLVFEYIDSAYPFHITLYQDSWDGSINIRDVSGDHVQIGPYCLHLTVNGNHRFFFQMIQEEWVFVTDYGNPSEAIMNTFRELFSEVERFFINV